MDKFLFGFLFALTALPVAYAQDYDIYEDDEVITVDSELSFLGQVYDIERARNGGLFGSSVPAWVDKFSHTIPVTLPKQLSCEKRTIEEAREIWREVESRVFQYYRVFNRDESLVLLPPSCGKSRNFPWDVPEKERELDQKQRLQCVFETCQEIKVTGKLSLKGYDYRNQLTYFSHAVVAKKDLEAVFKLLAQSKENRPREVEKQTQIIKNQYENINNVRNIETDWKDSYRSLILSLSELRQRLGLAPLHVNQMSFNEFKSHVNATREYIDLLAKNANSSSQAQSYIKILGPGPITRQSAMVLCSELKRKELSLEVEINSTPSKFLTYKKKSTSMSAVGVPRSDQLEWTAVAYQKLKIPGLSDSQMNALYRECKTLDISAQCFEKMMTTPLVEEAEKKKFNQECSGVVENERFLVELPTHKIISEEGDNFFITPFRMAVDKFFNNLQLKSNEKVASRLNSCTAEIVQKTPDIEILFLNDWAKNLKHQGSTLAEKKMHWLNAISHEAGIPEFFTYSLPFKVIRDIYSCVNTKSVEYIRQRQRERVTSGNSSCLWETPVACSLTYLTAMSGLTAPVTGIPVLFDETLFAAHMGRVSSFSGIARADALVSSAAINFFGYFNPNGVFSYPVIYAAAEATKLKAGQVMLGHMMGLSQSMIEAPEYWEGFRKNIYETKLEGWKTNSPYIYCGNDKESCVSIKQFENVGGAAGLVGAVVVTSLAANVVVSAVLPSKFVDKVALAVGARLFPKTFARDAALGLTFTRTFLLNMAESLPNRSQNLISALTTSTSGTDSLLMDVFDKFVDMKVVKDSQGNETFEVTGMKTQGIIEITKVTWNLIMANLVGAKLNQMFPNTSPKFLERLHHSSINSLGVVSVFTLPRLIEGTFDLKAAGTSLLFATTTSLITASRADVAPIITKPRSYTRQHQKFIKDKNKEGYSFAAHPQVIVHRNNYYYLAEKSIGDKVRYELVQVDKRLRADIKPAEIVNVGALKGGVESLEKAYDKLMSAKAVRVTADFFSSFLEEVFSR